MLRLIDVVSACIWKDQSFLICQRPAGKSRGLLWEFPGGKVEPGETRQQALTRECQEELGITLQVGAQRAAVDHAYPDVTIHLSVWDAVISQGIPQQLEHNALQWITPAQADGYTFCPADTALLQQMGYL